MATSAQISVPRRAPVVHDQIIALRAQGLAIAKIAKQLGIARNTVKRHLRSAQIDMTLTKERLQDLIPDAIEAVHKSIKGGDGKLALQLLKDMNAVGQIAQSTGDTTLNAAINVLIQAPSTVSPGPPIDAITVDHAESNGTEAAAKPPQGDLGVDD